MFAHAIARGPLRGPLAGAYVKNVWLSQTSSIVTPRVTLVRRPTWLQTMFGYRSDMFIDVQLTNKLLSIDQYGLTYIHDSYSDNL